MDLHLIDDIRPITDFRNQAADLLKQVQETKSPMLITQRGRSAAILIDVRSYQEQCEQLELLRAIAQGKEDIDKGRTYAHEDVMKELNEWLK